jgi:hypothetical protein
MAWGTKSNSNNIAGRKPETIEANPNIKAVVEQVLIQFKTANAFGIPPDFAGMIVDAFNPVEGVSADVFSFETEDGQERVFYPAKITHKGASAGNTAFSTVCPDYGERAMAFGALAVSLQWAFAQRGPIEGVTYSIFTEYSNTNWNAVNAGDRADVQRNTYSVYRMYITPQGDGQAFTIAKCYSHRGQKAQTSSEANTTSAPTQSWGKAPSWNK